MQPKLVGGNYFTIIEQDLDPDQNDVMEYDPVKKDWSPSKRLIAVWDEREIEMFVQPPIQQIQPGAIAPVIENPSTDEEEVDDDSEDLEGEEEEDNDEFD